MYGNSQIRGRLNPAAGRHLHNPSPNFDDDYQPHRAVGCGSRHRPRLGLCHGLSPDHRMKPTDYIDGPARVVAAVPVLFTALMFAVLIGVGIAQ